MKKDIQPSYGEAVVSLRAGRSWWTAADGSIASRSGTACKFPPEPLHKHNKRNNLPSDREIFFLFAVFLANRASVRYT